MDYAIKDSTHWKRLVRFVSYRLGGCDAEDLLQTAYVRLCERHGTEVRNADAFLVRTAINAGIDEMRRHKKNIDHAGDELLDAISDTAPGQEDVLAARQRLIQVRKILDAMKPRTRDILLMHRLEGMSYREIGSTLGISQSAVEKHISRGMRQLLAMTGEA